MSAAEVHDQRFLVLFDWQVEQADRHGEAPGQRPDVGGVAAFLLDGGPADQVVEGERGGQRRQPHLVRRAGDRGQPVHQDLQLGRAGPGGELRLVGLLHVRGVGAQVERQQRPVAAAGAEPFLRADVGGGDVGDAESLVDRLVHFQVRRAGDRGSLYASVVPMTVRLSAALKVRRQIR